MIFETEDNVLGHFGVKGMHWGVRKSRDSDSSSKTKKPSRKERRAAKQAATQKKVEDLVKSSLRDRTQLVLLNGQQVVTGEEFVQHMSNGGYMNARTTRLYARQQSKGGPYVLEPKPGR